MWQRAGAGLVSVLEPGPSGTIYYHPAGFDTPEIGRWLCGDLPYFYFRGLIDEVEIFDRSLTDEEIEAIYGAGSSGKVKPPLAESIAPPDGLVSWWPADGDAIDGNHGALVGGATYAPGLVDRAFSLDGNGDYCPVSVVHDIIRRFPKR